MCANMCSLIAPLIVGLVATDPVRNRKNCTYRILLKFCDFTFRRTSINGKWYSIFLPAFTSSETCNLLFSEKPTFNIGMNLVVSKRILNIAKVFSYKFPTYINFRKA